MRTCARGHSGTSNLAPIGRQLISLAIPIFASNILGLLDGSINAIWLGRFLGATALAAAVNANTVLIFLFALALGIWTALTIQVGFYLGVDRREDTAQVVRAAWAVFIIVGVSVAGSAEILSGWMLGVLGVPRESMEFAEQYLRLILLSVPINYVFGMIVAALRGAGDTKTTFRFCLLSIGLDAALNPLFIFGLGPIPRLGIKGAALATVLSQAIGLAALVFSLIRRRHFLCLPQERFVLRCADWRKAGELLRRGGTMGVEFLSESLLAILMISLVNRFGSYTTAAFGAANQLWGCVMMPSMAVSLASTSMAANSFGAGNWKRVRAITCIGVTLSVLTASALVMILECLDGRVFSLFLSARSPALAVASEINRVASWSCVAFAGCVALMGTPRAAGAVWGPLLVSVIGIVIRFALAEELLHQWQARGIWWSFPISGIITMIATAFYYQLRSWRSALPRT